MKEKIQKLAEGIFENNDPEIRLSTTSIREVVGECAQFSGHFFVESLSGEDVEGYVYPSHVRMKCPATRFSGKKCRIDYEVNLRGLAFGDEVSGTFTLITNGGEFTVPCTLSVEKSFFKCPSGPVKNLFHFANFAREDWDGAVKFFGGQDFIHILAGNDRQYRKLYAGLKREGSMSQAMDEFLVAVHKKERVHISLMERERSFSHPMQKEKHRLFLEKSTWGYVTADVQAEGNFIQLEKSRLSAEDFLGNTCEVPYYIEPEALHGGLNLGRIRIATSLETLYYYVSVDMRRDFPLWEIKEQLLKGKIALIRIYLDFRKKKVNQNEFYEQGIRILSDMEKLEQENILFRLLRIQLLLLGKKEQEAGWYLESFEKAKELKEQDEELYGYYLYLRACYKKESRVTRKALEEIRSLYQRNSASFCLLWTICYLDEELKAHPERKWKLIREQFERGCHSPLLYLEAYILLLEDDALLKSLDNFTLQVLNFAIKEEMFSSGWCERILSISVKGMPFSPLLYKLYKKLYVMLPVKERLKTLLGLLIRGQKTGGEYTRWYAMGVEKNLKVAGVFENYMESVGWKQKGPLPQNLLLYYAMDPQLSVRKKAWLYARVILQREQMPAVYRQCQENIRTFVLEQQAAGAIWDDLAVLYQDFFRQELLKEPTKREEGLEEMSDLVFWHKVECRQKGIAKVLTLHYNLTGEEVYLCQNQSAYVPIFTGLDQVILVDEAGRKYTRAEEDFVLQPLFSEPRFLTMFSGKSFGMMIRTEIEGERYRIISTDNVEKIVALADDRRLLPEFRNELKEELILFYRNSGRRKELLHALSKLEPEHFSDAARSRILELMLAEGLYDQAWPLLQEYGFSDLHPGKLVGILSWRIREQSYEWEEALVKLCQQVFHLGKYNEPMLSYLVRHANGKSRRLRTIWQAAAGFDLETEGLGKRLLEQALWTGAEVSGLEDVMARLAKAGGNSTLAAAYLAKTAYGYVIQEKTLRGEIWGVLEAELKRNEEGLSILCKLAWLKGCAEGKSEDIDRKLLVSARKDCRRKKLVFPFFKELEKRTGFDFGMDQQVVIAYKAEPDSRVTLHYMIENGEPGEAAYRKEPMKHMLEGIFIRQFTLFYGERLEYYITEGKDEESKLIRHQEIFGEEPAKEGKSRRQLLGRMETDTNRTEEELLSVLDEYITLDYMTGELFKKK